ncbi:sensor histidine kinase, partial [Tsukamurella soli]
MIVACAMVIGAGVMLLMLYKSQNAVMYSATSSKAYGIAEQIEEHGLPGVSRSSMDPTSGVDIIQVLDGSNRVVYASPDPNETPISQVRPAPGEVARFETRVPGRGGSFCGAAAGTEHDGEKYVVIAVVGASTYRHGVLITGTILALEFPVVLAVAGLAIYIFVGRTLRPVHRITSEVSAISSTDLACRVPVPDSDDEIHTLAVTMNGMLARLERSRDTQIQFLGDASHELRGPLTTLSGILDLADHTGTDITVDTVRSVLLPEATRMGAVVDDLLLLARVDERGLPLVLSDVDVDDLVLAEVAAARATGGVTVRTRIQPVRVTGDATQLARCLRNLVDNARRHARGTVVLD